jgi:hypothetical protein
MSSPFLVRAGTAETFTSTLLKDSQAIKRSKKGSKRTAKKKFMVKYTL